MSNILTTTPTHEGIPEKDQYHDLLRAAQFCYYVHAISVLTDIEFDHAVAELSSVHGVNLPVGSDKADDYPQPVRALAVYLVAQLNPGQEERASRALDLYFKLTIAEAQRTFVKKVFRPRPSQLNSVALCPSWRPDETEGKDTKASDEGTLMHRAVETTDLSILDADGCDLATAEERKAQVEKILGFRDDILNRSTYHWFELNFPESHDLLGGTSDFCALADFGDHAVLIIADWKFGRKQVPDASENLQGQRYVLGCVETIKAKARSGELEARFGEPGFIRAAEVHFLMPRLDLISSATFDLDFGDGHEVGLQELIERLQKVAMAVALPDQVRPEVLSLAGCLYCGAKATCAATRRRALEVVSAYKPEDELPFPDIHPSQTDTPEGHANNLANAKILEEWVGSVKAHALQFRNERGLEIPGYELGTKTTKKDIEGADVLAAYQEVVGRNLLPPEAFLTACSVSPTALGKVAYDIAEKPGKGKARDELVKVLRDNGLVRESTSPAFLQKIRSKK